MARHLHIFFFSSRRRHTRLQGDWSSDVCSSDLLIVSNPPYVPLTERTGLQREVRDWEPQIALFGGETGFELYERIVAAAPRVLRPRGWLILELGFGSLSHVAGLLRAWDVVRIEPDLAGIPRVIAARRHA